MGWGQMIVAQPDGGTWGWKNVERIVRLTLARLRKTRRNAPFKVGDDLWR